MYRIDRTNLKKERKFKLLFGIGGGCFIGIFVVMLVAHMLGLVEGMRADNPMLGIVLTSLFSGVFFWVAFDGVKKYNEKMAKYDYLEQYGRLERGLKYRLNRTGTVVNGREILQIVVDYELPSGSVVRLFGDGRYDHQYADADGLVDLLIDPNDPNNYYIDFSIGERY